MQMTKYESMHTFMHKPCKIISELFLFVSDICVINIRLAH